MSKARDRKPYIICVGANGRAVVYGYCDAEPVLGEPCTLHNARMLLYWAGTRGLFGVAARGPAPESRITCVVPVTIAEPVQVLAVTAAAATALDEWPDA